MRRPGALKLGRRHGCKRPAHGVAYLQRTHMRAQDLLLRAALGFLAVVPVIAAPVTFHQHIAPLVYRNCTPCHRPGESAPFSLLTYDDVKRHAAQIAVVTKRRYMPPWLPETGHGEFAEE